MPRSCAASVQSHTIEYDTSNQARAGDLTYVEEYYKPGTTMIDTHNPKKDDGAVYISLVP
jgi:hypothetical protein